MKRRKIERETKRMRNEKRLEKKTVERIKWVVGWMEGRKEGMEGRKDWLVEMNEKSWLKYRPANIHLLLVCIYFWNKIHFNVEFEMWTFSTNCTHIRSIVLCDLYLPDWYVHVCFYWILVQFKLFSSQSVLKLYDIQLIDTKLKEEFRKKTE